MTSIPQKISETILEHYKNNWQDIFGDCEKLQRNVLADILSQAQDCQYALDYNFRNISSYEQYVHNVPIKDYLDFKPYIEKNMQTNAHELSQQKTAHYLKTTGTTGQAKYFIETNLGAKAKELAVDMWNYSIARKVEVLQDPNVKILIIVNNIYDDYADNGLAIVRSSAAAVKILYQRHPQIYIHPFSVYEVAITNQDRNYLQAFYALKEKNFNVLFCNNLAHFGIILDCIETNFPQLLKDIRYGKLSINLTEADRYELEKDLAPDFARAAELEQIFNENDGALSYDLIWPNFVFVGTWLSGSIGHIADDVLRRLPDKVKCISEGYGCSEAMINIPMEFNEPNGVISSFGYFFEFLPINGGAPLPAWQVKDGGYYELILTTYSGLYRYNLHDIVKVEGFLGTTPKIKFCCKSSDSCFIGNEVFYAYQLDEFVRKAEKIYGTTFTFYQAFCEDNQLQLIIQPFENDYDSKKIYSIFEQLFSAAGIPFDRLYIMNQEYRTYLFQQNMTNGRNIQSIKLWSIIKQPPKSHILEICDHKML